MEGRSDSAALTCSIALVIELADDGQIETAGDRIDGDYEVGTATRAFKSARASDKVKDALVHTCHWIEDTDNLGVQLISV